ncbi:MAG: hypothetical protein JOY83_21040 [Alphaproteobacteria bacterium]|nr:hypothetical protein [Alphaproteobacteria bacterium]
MNKLDETDTQQGKRAKVWPPSSEEIHDRLDKIERELSERRRNIAEERQRRAAIKARAEKLRRKITDRQNEYLEFIRRTRGIAREAGLRQFLPEYTTDDSQLNWAFAEIAKLEDPAQPERPAYLAFLNVLFAEFGPQMIEEMKKESLKQEIRKRWPPECGRPSDNLVDPMATILRSLKAKRGGAKPQKKRQSAAPAVTAAEKRPPHQP